MYTQLPFKAFPEILLDNYTAKMFSHANDLYYTLERPDIYSSTIFPRSPSFNNCIDDIFIPTVSSTAEPTPQAVVMMADTKMPSCASPLFTSRKRLTRKDRHSKIHTAQGPRDRRMRLSLDVARKFFDLQDLLGFDKASKTVQWLLSMSKAAIKELARTTLKRDASSSSDDEEGISNVSDDKGKSTSTVHTSILENNMKTSKANKSLRSRPVLQPKISRELREKARARARERTLEKKMMRAGQHGDESKENQQQASSQELKSCLDIVAEFYQEHCSESPIYEHNRLSSPAAEFDYNEQVVLSLIQEPWDHMSFASSYMDEKHLFGELLLQTSNGRQISTPSIFDHVV